MHKFQKIFPTVETYPITDPSKLMFTCSKSPTETVGKGTKYVQS